MLGMGITFLIFAGLILFSVSIGRLNAKMNNRVSADHIFWKKHWRGGLQVGAALAVVGAVLCLLSLVA